MACAGCGKPITGSGVIIKGRSIGVTTVANEKMWHPLCVEKERRHVLVNHPDGQKNKTHVCRSTKHLVMTSFGTFHRDTGKMLVNDNIYITDID